MGFFSCNIFLEVVRSGERVREAAAGKDRRLVRMDLARFCLYLYL